MDCTFPADSLPQILNAIKIVDEAMHIVLGKDYIPGVINIVHGSGKVVGETIINSKDIDLISFTGSTAIGKRINEVGG